MLTIDTSVWINADLPAEPGHADSRTLLDRLAAGDVQVVVPTLLRVEVAGVISRVRGDPVLAVDFANEIAVLPFLRWVDLDDVLAEQSVTVAASRKLRGADAVYAAVAREYGCDLVSLDNEHLKRLTSLVPTYTPAQVMARM